MAARSMWKGNLVVGRKRIGVNLYAAVQDRDVHLHLLHGKDGVRVRQRLANPADDSTVDPGATRRGYELEPGRYVVLDAEDLAALEPEPSRDIEVAAFVPRGAIDHRWYGRPYWLGPERVHAHAHAYACVAAAMERTGREGFARWTMRKREYSGALVLREGRLALVTLRHAEEVVAASGLVAPGGRALDERELALARQLVAALSGPFEHAEFRDEYRERLLELIDRKKRGKRIRLAKFEPEPAGDDTLVKALERSLKSAG